MGAFSQTTNITGSAVVKVLNEIGTGAVASVHVCNQGTTDGKVTIYIVKVGATRTSLHVVENESYLAAGESFHLLGMPIAANEEIFVGSTVPACSVRVDGFTLSTVVNAQATSVSTAVTKVYDALPIASVVEISVVTTGFAATQGEVSLYVVPAGTAVGPRYLIEKDALVVKGQAFKYSGLVVNVMEEIYASGTAAILAVRVSGCVSNANA